MSYKNHIALISVYPPPYGGVSIHAKILAEELSDRNMINILITEGKKSKVDPDYLKRISNITFFQKFIFWHYRIPFFFALYSKRIKIIHCHEGFSCVPLLFLHRFIFRKSIIHTIHNQWITEHYNRLNFLKKAITNLFLKDKKTFWICVNDNAFQQMLKLGAKKECIALIPAYIPAKKNAVVNSNDLLIKQAIEKFKNEDKLIGIYGFMLSFDSRGRDIYGFNFSIDVLKELIKTRPFIKLLILIPNATPLVEKENILLKIDHEGLKDNILPIFDNPIINMNIFWNLLDVYFRPTTDDGDSLAIREALANNVTVVASDVCTRPLGTILYKSMNFDNAVEKLNEALNHSEKCEIVNENYLPKILDVYEKCVSNLT